MSFLNDNHPKKILYSRYYDRRSTTRGVHHYCLYPIKYITYDFFYQWRHCYGHLDRFPMLQYWIRKFIEITNGYWTREWLSVRGWFAFFSTKKNSNDPNELHIPCMQIHNNALSFPNKNCVQLLRIYESEFRIARSIIERDISRYENMQMYS